MFASGN